MNTRLSFYKLIALLVCFVYLAGFGFEYLLDALGRSPVLDANENLAWAGLIADGQLPDEPLYRALLYPWLLSLFHVEGALLAQLATLFGVCCHCLNALLVAVLAGRLWQNRLSVWLSGVLYLLYPVSMYFSVQVLDMTFAMTLFLAGLLCVVRGSEAVSLRSRWGCHIAAGLLLGLSVLARPNFLLPLFCVPFAPFILQPDVTRRWRQSVLPACLLSVAMLLPLLGQGVYNVSKSGDFRVLPWQGAYNLYAANHATANGKFFTQSVSFDQIPRGMNPTRMESEYLYRQAREEAGSTSIDSMNRYWRSELWQEVSADPLRWLKLLGRKSLYVLNDWEQYNNLTYAFHKARFSSLRWNPLGWGVLLLGGVVCAVLGYPRAQRGVFISLGLLGLAYAAGVLLFFASARFRLPLVPLLAVLCGGWAVLPWREWCRTRRRALIQVGVGCLLAALCVYGNIFDARDEASFIQDELLLADACAKLGEDAEALRYAEAVLLRDSTRTEARRIQVVSLFNLWLVEPDVTGKSVLWSELQQSLGQLPEFDAPSLFIRGVVAWREGDLVAAKSSWREAIQRYGQDASSSAQALQLIVSSEGGGAAVQSGDALWELLFSK